MFEPFVWLKLGLIVPGKQSGGLGGKGTVTRVGSNKLCQVGVGIHTRSSL